MADSQESSPRRGPLPGRVVMEREQLLHLFCPAGFVSMQDRQCLSQLGIADVLGHGARVNAAVDAVEDGRKVEQLAAGFEVIRVERLRGGQRGHGRSFRTPGASDAAGGLTGPLTCASLSSAGSSQRRPSSASNLAMVTSILSPACGVAGS